MEYGEFLVPVTGGDDDARILPLAHALHEQLGVCVTLLYAEPDPADVMVWSADGMVVGAGLGVVETLKKASDEVWAKILKELGDNPKFNFEREMGALSTILPQRAALSDLLVVSSQCAQGRGLIASAFEEALMRGHCPTLILRDECKFDFKKILICWDGSVQAAHAAHAARPFLAKADTVDILQFNIGNKSPVSPIYDPKKLAASLKHHNIECNVHLVEPLKKSVGDSLLHFANEGDYCLIVAGAYGHSRAQEMVFGGATKSLLNAKSGPHLLVSH